MVIPLFSEQKLFINTSGVLLFFKKAVNYGCAFAFASSLLFLVLLPW
jgi:hypothetical protein